MPIQYDRGQIGQSADLGTHQITADMINRYATAIGHGSTDEKGPIAGPMFCNVLTSGAAEQPKVKVEGGRRRFMAGQSYEPLAPIRPGDSLKAVVRIADMYEKTGRSGGMLFVIRETTFTNQDNLDVAKIRHSLVIQE